MQEWKRESLQGRRSCLGPSGTQEYSSFLVVEESEVGGQCFILERCCHGDPVELDSSGRCEDDQMRANPMRSQRRGSKILLLVRLSCSPLRCGTGSGLLVL
jgi:hypothetical protein